jgi:O-antigen ligase
MDAKTAVSDMSSLLVKPRVTGVTVFLVVCACMLLPFSRSVEIPLALLTFMGLYFVATESAVRNDPAIKQFSVVFLLFFVPMLLALPDAVNFEVSSIKTLLVLRYYLAGITIIYFLRSDVKRVFPWVSVILVVWSIDAFIQVYTGADVFGYALYEGRANSMFGLHTDGLKLGWGIVIFFPVSLIWFVHRFSWPVTLLLSCMILYALVLSGTRSAWVVGIIELVLIGAYLSYTKKIRWTSMIVSSVLVLGISVAAVQSSSKLSARVNNVIIAFEQQDYEAVDRALSSRLGIWQTAGSMIADNWVNGVGVRGFRYAYEYYAEDGDQWAQPFDDGRSGSVVSHAHQLVLEVMAETGIIGLLGLIGILIIVIRIWWRSNLDARRWSLPFMVAIIGFLFPINSVLSFYSSWFAQQFWLLIALFFAASIVGRDVEPSDN